MLLASVSNAGIAPCHSVFLRRSWQAACRGSVLRQLHCSRSASSMVPAAQWQSLNTPPHELCLHNTLPTGQSFRWRQTYSETYTGVIGQRVVQLKQLDHDVHWRVLARGPLAPEREDAAVMREYFNLHTSLATLSIDWSERDDRFRRIAPCIPGARMLQQDPTECLFQFICSSNNHISRIHGMVERLCSTYGSKLLYSSGGGGSSSSSSSASTAADMIPETAEEPLAGQVQQQLAFYAFPTLEQLSAATEEALRAAGFGYRAKFIVGSAQQLLAKPEGGSAWLLNLRSKPYAEAHEALCSLPGIGPKVAACICLFSLNKHDAIPVDTHVWTLATRYYAPHLANKTLNKKLHDTIQQVFVDRFGPYAGWAHNTLFISELASHKPLLPAGLASPGGRGANSSSKKGKKRSSASSGDDCDGEAAVAAAVAAASIEAEAVAEAVRDVALSMVDQNATVPAGVTVLQKAGSTAGMHPAKHEPANIRASGSSADGINGPAALGSSRRSSRRRKRNHRYSDGVVGADSSDQDG